MAYYRLYVRQASSSGPIVVSMPAIAGGFQKKAESGQLQRVTAQANAIGQPDTDAGNNILSHIFGSKDVSRQVADHAASSNGISSSVMKALLPIAAAMVAKYIAGSAAGGAGEGGLGGMLGQVLGGGGLGGLGGMLAGGSRGSNPLDDILAGAIGRR